MKTVRRVYGLLCEREESTQAGPDQNSDLLHAECCYDDNLGGTPNFCFFLEMDWGLKLVDEPRLQMETKALLRLGVSPTIYRRDYIINALANNT